MRTIWMVLFLVFCFDMASGQRYSFVEYSIADGLSSPNVTCFAQDSLGFTWVGTENGLNRFDGTTFKTYNAPEGLPHPHVTRLCWVAKGLFGATNNGKLFTLQNGLVKELDVEEGELSEIYDLQYMGDTLWIAAMRGVYSYADGKCQRTLSFPDESEMAVSRIAFASKGEMWVATHHFGIYQRKGAKLEPMLMPDIRGVLDLAIDQNGHFLLGGHYFLLKVNGQEIEEYRPQNGRSRNWSNCIVRESKDGLWLGSDQTGLYHFDLEKKQLTHFSEPQGLNAKSIKCLFLDPHNRLWIGTANQGFYMLLDTRLKLHDQFADNNVNGLYMLKDQTPWVSTLSGGLYQWGTKTDVDHYITRKFAINANYDYFRFIPYDSLTTRVATFLDRQNKIPKQGYTVWAMEQQPGVEWFGMNYALFRRQAGQTIQYQHNNRNMASDVVYSLQANFDTLWAGLEVGAAGLVDTTVVWRYKSPEDVNNSTKIIFQDSRQRVWLGGNKSGLLLKVGNGVRPADLDPAWKSTHITDIVEDEQKRIWVSSNGLGLVVLSRDEKTYLNPENSLPSGNVMSIALNQHFVVVGTDKGVYSAKLTDLSKLMFKSVDVSGQFAIPCTRNAAQVDTSGTFWVGTAQGVFQFNPGQNTRRYPAPKPYLQQSQLLYASTPLDSFANERSEIVISYADNSLRFKVGAIYYQDQQEVEYSYYLQGSSRRWSEANVSTDITFNDLRPGPYTLQLRCRDRKGDWSEINHLLTFKVETPFWLSSWFYTAISALLIAAIAGAITLRTRQLKKRNKELEDYAQARTQEVKDQNAVLEEQHQEKEALLQEIHHRVKNNLQIIISLLRMQLRRITDAASQEVLNQSIGRINTMSLIHQSLYQTDNLARTNFKSYIKELMDHIMSNFQDISQINYTLKGDEIELNTETAIPLALITHEWVNNIYKHAFPAKVGLIQITLEKQLNGMRMEITDNGIGISKAEFMASKSSLGARIMRTLSNQLNAELMISRRPTGGTALVLQLNEMEKV